MQPSQKPTIEQIVERRLIRARDIVRRVYQLPKDAEDYSLSDVTSEVLHQLGAESLSKRIQASKEKNVREMSQK